MTLRDRGETEQTRAPRTLDDLTGKGQPTATGVDRAAMPTGIAAERASARAERAFTLWARP